MTQAKDSVKVGNGLKAFIIIAAVAIIVLLIFTLTIDKEVIPEGYVNQAAVDVAVANAVNSALVGVNEKNLLIEELQNQLAEQKVIVDAVDEVVNAEGFLVDEIFLNSATGYETYSDRELNLFDGKVDFDGESFDAEETLALDGIEVLANGHDYDGNVFMNVFASSVAYKLEFESTLNESAITEDETLVFNFLGTELEVSEWEDDTLIFLHGDNYLMNEGETLTIGEDTIELIYANDDSAYFKVNGNSKKINEGSIGTIANLQIKLEYTIGTTSFRLGQVSILVAEDIEKSVTNGELYEDDSPWEWTIGTGYIGLVLVEDFDEVDADGDTEFQAIGVGETICLPGEYVCLVFNGLSIEDVEEYSLSLDSRAGFDFVRIDGNFINGLNDLDRIYVNVSDKKFYNRDLVEIIGDIELGNTDSLLTAGPVNLIFEDFKVNYALDSSNVGTDNEDYLTDYGILVNSPENSIDDQDWTIAIPEKQLESSFNIVM